MAFGSGKGFTPGDKGLQVAEADGAPDVSGVTKIVVSNGTLTNDNNGQVTIDTSGAGEGITADENTTFTGVITLNHITASRGIDAGDKDIINVGNIALDSISSDAGTSVTVTLGTDAGDDFLVGNNSALVVEGDNDRVGVGTAAPSGALHVMTEVAGVTAHAGAKDFVVESNGTMGMSLLGGPTNSARIYFGSSGGNRDGKIDYNLNDDVMQFGTADSTRMVIDSTGQVGIGVTDPDTTLEVFDTTTQLKLSYDASNHATNTVAADGELTVTTVGTDAGITFDPANQVINFGNGSDAAPVFAFQAAAEGIMENRYRVGNKSHFIIVTDETPDRVKLCVTGTDSGNQIVITTIGNRLANHDHATPGDPTLFIHSTADPNGDNEQWLGLRHNSEYGILESGKSQLHLSGGVTLGDDQSNVTTVNSQLTASTGIRIETVADFNATSRYKSDQAGLISWNLPSPATSLDKFKIRASTGVNLSLGSNNTEDQLYISGTAGNVGIGTVTPIGKLDVFGTDTQLVLSYDASNYIQFSASSGGDLSVTPSGNDITFDETQALFIQDLGDVKIRLDSADGANTNKRFDITCVTADNYGSLGGQNNPHILVVETNASGNVGIGTTTPAARFEIVQTDAVVTGLSLNKDYEASAPAGGTIRGIHVDFDKTGATTTDNQILGIDVDIDNATATDGTNMMTGISVTPTLTHSADAGTPTVKGAVITATGGTNGTAVATGMELTSTGADSNNGLIINCADGGTDLQLLSSADTGDLFKIETTTHGATTITTVDDDATAANLALTIDGDITATAAGGDIVMTTATANAVGGGFDGAAAQTVHVSKINGEIVTTVLVDIEDLYTSGDEKDIIGEDGVAAAYITQITTAVNGLIYKAEMSCIEVPAGSNCTLDIDLVGGSDSLAEDVAYDFGGATGTTLIQCGGNWAAGQTRTSAAQPGAGGVQSLGATVDDFLYLTTGDAASSGGQYTAGKFVIKLYGASF